MFHFVEEITVRDCRVAVVILLECFAVIAPVCRAAGKLAVSGRELLRTVREAEHSSVKPASDQSEGGKAILSISELLDRIATSQDEAAKIVSYVVKSEESVQGQCSFMGRGTRKTHGYDEYVTDGERFYKCRKQWGRCLMGQDILISKEDSSWTSWLWDGQLRFFYGKLPTKHLKVVAQKRYKTAQERAQFVAERAGTVTISAESPNRGKVSSSFNDFQTGYLPGDSRRIDEILREAHIVSVRHKLEKVGKSNCYVIDAETKYGKYNLWIDSKHGYNIAKARGFKGPHDIKVGAWGVPETMEYSLDNVRFVEIENMWVLMESDKKYAEKYASGDFMKTSSHWKRTQLVFDPNHKALRSFDPNIPNGWRVTLSGFEGVDETKKYRWKDGGVVDEKGNEIALRNLKAKQDKAKKEH